MAAWAAILAIQTLIDTTTGALDTTARTVELQPTDQAYPTGKINCTQMSSLYSYLPDSALDTETHYWRYVDGSKTKKMVAYNSEPAVAE